ncbi:MAG: ABC transporter substrate-binding protein [Proteobacteria bacterium]|nr:ABC transporter substrate-binding protein [Pseudomonadota bacterium]
MRIFAALLLMVATIATAPALAAEEARPERIVSLNLCTDQLLIALAEPGRIAALSHLSRDPDISYYAEAARAFPSVPPDAHAVMRHEPDLVLAMQHSARNTVALLERLGYRVLDLPVAERLADVGAQIRALARALGEVARGEALIAEMEAALAALDPQPSTNQPTAIVYQANGFTIGAPSLVDDLLAAAGFHNLARDLRLTRQGRLPLEALIYADPDLLIIEEARVGSPSLADQLLRHPVLERARPRSTVRVSADLWTCGGPFSVEASRRLAALRALAPWEDAR